MTVKLLTEHHLEFLSLKGGCAGSCASTLVKMSNCWKSRVTAQILSFKFSKSNEKPLFYLHINYDLYIHIDDCKTSIGMWFKCLCVWCNLTSWVYNPHAFFKKSKGDIVFSSVCLSVRPPVITSPHKPLDEIQPNLVCELLTWMGHAAVHFGPAPWALGTGQKIKF